MQTDTKIAKLYNEFNEKILSIIQESQKTTKGYFNKRKEITEKQSFIAEHYAVKKSESGFTLSREHIREMDSLMDERRKVNLGMFLSNNANFIYLMALYESYLNSLVKILINEHKATRVLYMQYFSSKAKEEFKKGNEKLFNVLTDPKKCIENLDELQPLMSLLNHLIGHKTDDEIYQRNYGDYLEARERRNLFVHRGTVLDGKYEQSLKGLFASNNLNKKFKFVLKEVKDNSFSLPSEWMGGQKDCKHVSAKDEGNCKNCTAKFTKPPGYDLKVGPGYLFHVYQSIFFLSSVIYRKAIRNISNKNSEVEKSEVFDGVIHEHMSTGLDMNYDDPTHIGTAIEINAYCFNNITRNEDDITLVNYILCINEVVQYNLQRPISDQEDLSKVDLHKLISYEKDRISDEKIKSILQAYLDQDFEMYIKLSLKFLENNKELFKSWFMTKKLLKNKKFKSMFNKLK